MSSSRSCPACGLVNPPESLVCDCGFDFTLGGIPVVVVPERPEHQSGFDAFLRNNAGKLLAAASMIWLAGLGLSIAGYQARRRG